MPQLTSKEFDTLTTNLYKLSSYYFNRGEVSLNKMKDDFTAALFFNFADQLAIVREVLLKDEFELTGGTSNETKEQNSPL